jgi:hypothetical protein
VHDGKTSPHRGRILVLTFVSTDLNTGAKRLARAPIDSWNDQCRECS